LQGAEEYIDGLKAYYGSIIVCNLQKDQVLSPLKTDRLNS